MNTPRGKAWGKRHTNKKIRRILGKSEFVTGKTSGNRLNNAHWGSGIARKDVVPKPSDYWDAEISPDFNNGHSND